MKDILNHLADKNGLSEELYIQNVRIGVNEEYPFKDDEIAILRKEIASLRVVINELCELVLKSSLPVTEFVEYNEKVEAIKTEEKIKVML